MTEAEISHYRRRLLALKKRLGGDLSELEEEALRPVGADPSGGLSEVPVHPADLAADLYDEEVSLDLLANESQILAEVIDALGRIDQGTFGRCGRCHKEIPKDRLQALPFTPYCIACAGAIEAGRTPPAGSDLT